MVLRHQEILSTRRHVNLFLNVWRRSRNSLKNNITSTVEKRREKKNNSQHSEHNVTRRSILHLAIWGRLEERRRSSADGALVTKTEGRFPAESRRTVFLSSSPPFIYLQVLTRNNSDCRYNTKFSYIERRISEQHPQTWVVAAHLLSSSSYSIFEKQVHKTYQGEAPLSLSLSLSLVGE